MANWLSLEEALTQASSHITPIIDVETVNLHHAYKRVLASDVVAPIDVPPWDNSAMDGYAIQHNSNPTRSVTQTVYAGQLSDTPVSEHDCARIMTGAPIPPGADTVVMQENAERDGDTIRFIHETKQGANIRPKAGDIATGDVLFKHGHCLTSQDLMLLSSIGISNVDVIRRPKVAIVATGDELAEPGKRIEAHQIYESHRAGITAKLIELGCEVTDAGLLQDNQDTITKTFKSLAASHDLVISSGGVSVGDADWVKPALTALGTLHLWKLAIKPGKPFAFGQFGNCYFCGLPGNPVSAFVTFDQIVTPLISTLRGSIAKNKLTIPALLDAPLKRRPGRKEFARGHFYTDEYGDVHVSLLKKQSSSVMTSLTNANCYVVIDADCESIALGEKVFIQPFSTEC